MEDGDDDTSLTTELTQNGKSASDGNNVASDKVEWKVTFAVDDLTLPNSSKELFSHLSNVESTELDVKEDDISGQSIESKNFDLAETNIPEFLEDNCDKTKNIVEGENVSEQSDEIVCRRDHSEYLSVQSEVLYSKDRESASTSDEGEDNLHTSTEEEVKISSENERDLLYDKPVTASSDDLYQSQKQNECNKNCDSDDEYHKKPLDTSDSVNVTESDLGCEMNTSDSFSNSDSQNDNEDDETSSQKDKDTSETFESSANVNDSFQNDSSSVSSSLSQSSAKNSLSQQEKEDSFCEEASEMEVTCESESINIEEQRNFQGGLSLNALDRQDNFEESPPVNQKSTHDLGVEEMEISDSVNEGDQNVPVSHVPEVSLQMKQDTTSEQMEVDSSEWREHKTGQESDSDFSEDNKCVAEDGHKDMNEVVDEVCVNEERRMSNEQEGQLSETKEKEMSDEEMCEEVERETNEDNGEGESDNNENASSEDNRKNISKYIEEKICGNSETQMTEYNEMQMIECNETEMSESTVKEVNECVEKETSECDEKESFEDLERKTSEYNEDKTSEYNEDKTSEYDEDKTSECNEKGMSESSENEMSEDNKNKRDDENGKKLCEQIEQVTCEDSEQEIREEEKEMSVDEENNVNEVLLDQEECSLDKKFDASQTQVKNNLGKSPVTNYLGYTSESVHNFLDRQQEPSLMEYTSCAQETENKISDDEGTPVNHSAICSETVKVNGEVDAIQKNFDEHENNSSVKEKLILKRKLQSSPTQEQSPDSAENESCKINVCFKGFKKRYIAQVSEATAKQLEESSSISEDAKSKNKRSINEFVMEPSQVIVSHQQLADREQTDTPLTEYAQYLGLQPTVKFKCYNCGESGFPSMIKLQEHQNICLKNANTQSVSKPVPSPIVEPVPSTNFRITRKVYLCSACGTYYENWNLFLHMREVHKRHVCLFCLLMFSQADKLAGHLTTKHGIADDEYSSPEEFLNEYDSSFFVMCCSCEQMFTERDNFFDHLCGNLIESSGDQACSLCGLKGAHFPTCRKAFTDSNAVTSPSHSSHNSNVCSSEPPPSSQSTIQEKAPKYAGSAEKSSSRKSHPKQSDKINTSEKNRNRPECDDDYDISDAASYCHVNIDEPDKQKVLHSSSKDTSDQEIVNEPAVKCKKLCHENDSNNPNSKLSAETSKLTEEETKRNDSSEESVSYNSQPEVSIENDSFETSQNSEPVSKNILSSDDAKVLTEIPSELKKSPISINTQTADVNLEITSLSPLKSQKEHDSESDTSASAGDTRGSDDSSSGSEASSDENETGNNKTGESVKVVASDESDGDKSDSDKISIVVEVKSDEDGDKSANGKDYNTNVIGNKNDVSDNENSKNMEPEVKISEDKLIPSNTDSGEEQQDNVQIAGDDVPLLELTLEETMDTLPIEALVKECVKISCSTCVYCNHAKKIAVNGKQLVLHLLAEHRFEPVVCSDSGELIPVNGFIENLKGKLTELQDMYFNTDSYDSTNKSLTKPYDRTYECFHCHFITTLHKELYVHNRKMHQKTILLCIMCKSNFYSYSELLCHLCPGIYVPDSNISFRCCLCAVDGLPSAFRLMVHLRKRHHACDVCLETTGDQQKLSNHVWKHKLHHLCYRCGIAYRNKPDITKHLFWKHGTESVLCKKCLQKKWPHVYHFCIPPTAFLCEECNASFSRAVALKVHKRLHVGDIAYECDECQEKFISKKLMRRHKDKHKQEIEDQNKSVLHVKENKVCEVSVDNVNVENDGTDTNQVVDPKEEEMECSIETASNVGNSSKRSSDEFQNQQIDSEANKKTDETSTKKSKVVDVYDLPPLNLSESDDSEDDSPNKKVAKEVECEDSKTVSNHHSTELPLTKISQEGEPQIEEETQPVEIVDGVWDNFKNYKANLEKREILQAQVGGTLKTTESSTSFCSNDIDSHTMMDIILADHDYCIVPEKPKEESSPHVTNPDLIKTSQATSSGLEVEGNGDDKSESFGADHNYCFNTSPTEEERKESSEAVIQNPSSICPQTPPLQITNQPNSISITTPNSSPKKKQKSPKKKQKQSGSSSSSDSSSNSDSSSCTCGTNCSCSSTSSSSSGSSSSSSDSDSSSSEGRRRQAARRERRREKSKRKLDMESRGGTPPATASSIGMTETQGNNSLLGTPMQIDTSGTGMLQVDDGPSVAAPEPEETEFLIRESDLDTTETETDEDFYDKYPQRQANKLLAEKRNQLLLLAAVAPVNNGTLTKPSSPPAAPTVVQPEPVQKKKGKTKRHKKAQHNVSEKKVENKLKLNIPASYFNSPSFTATNPNLAVSPIVNSQNLSSSHVARVSRDTFSPAPETSSTPNAYHSTGSGSETESKRLSKRKRIPKRFYGDSSDEEGEQNLHQPYKWRKITPNNNTNPPPPPSPNVSGLFTFRNISVNVPAIEPVQPVIPQVKSDDDGDDSESGQEAKRSSSDSSNSDSDNEHSDGDSDVETATNVTNMLPSASGNVNQQKNENLYCYCQCPYDEVSEMIACDGKDCSIEWFHFECVGIMVPPKGKWFCPDCRKKTAGRSEYLLHA